MSAINLFFFPSLIIRRDVENNLSDSPVFYLPFPLTLTPSLPPTTITLSLQTRRKKSDKLKAVNRTEHELNYKAGTSIYKKIIK